MGRPKGSKTFDWEGTGAKTKLIQLLKDGLSYADCAKVLTDMYAHEFNIKSVNSAARRWCSTPFSDGVAEEAKLERQISAIQSQLQVYKKKCKILENFNEKIESVFTASISTLPAPKKLLSAKPKKQRKHQQANLILSDMQVGTNLKPSDVVGLEEYNVEVYKQRLNKLEEDVISIVDHESTTHIIDALNIFMPGDNIEGEVIFGNQQSYIDLNLVDQITVGAQYTSEFIRSISRFVPTVKLFCVPGNHGRPTSRKGQIHEASNMDYLFLKFMAQELKDIKDIKFFISKTTVMGIRLIDKFNFLLSHGDETRSYVGIPFYGLARDTLKHAEMTGINFIAKIVGHFHQPAEISLGQATKLIVNGSFVRGTNFSVKNMKQVNVPTQKIFGLHPDRGITWSYDLALADVTTLSADNKGIFTPYDTGIIK